MSLVGKICHENPDHYEFCPQIKKTLSLGGILSGARVSYLMRGSKDRSALFDDAFAIGMMNKANNNTMFESAWKDMSPFGEVLGRSLSDWFQTPFPKSSSIKMGVLTGIRDFDQPPRKDAFLPCDGVEGVGNLAGCNAMESTIQRLQDQKLKETFYRGTKEVVRQLSGLDLSPEQVLREWQQYRKSDGMADIDLATAPCANVHQINLASYVIKDSLNFFAKKKTIRLKPDAISPGWQCAVMPGINHYSIAMGSDYAKEMIINFLTTE